MDSHCSASAEQTSPLSTEASTVTGSGSSLPLESTTTEQPSMVVMPSPLEAILEME